MNTENRAFRYWLLAAALLTFLSLMMGYGMRFESSAQGCPDFPTCYGQFNIPLESAARIEMAHRVLAALSGIITIGLTVWAWIRVKNGGRKWTLTGAAILFTAQLFWGMGLSGTIRVEWLAVVHLAAALITMGLLTVSATVSFLPRSTAGIVSLWYRSRLVRLSAGAAAILFLLMLSGVLVARLGAASACAGFPFCNGSLPASLPAWLAFGHRVLTLLAGILVAVLYLHAHRAYRHQPLILTAAAGLMVLLGGQALIGALKIQRNFPLDLVIVHAAINAAVWVVLMVLVTAAIWFGHSGAEEKQIIHPQISRKERLKAYLMLNKPIIVALLLVTTYAGMVVGGKAVPSLGLTFWTLLGGALAAGGSSALNQYIDRQIDSAMQRTSRRPIPAGILTPAEALAYGFAACLAAFFILTGFVNLLAALLAVAGMVYYVLIYSIWLKHLTVQNIVIGGGAGAIPPLVGWAAAAGSLNVPSLFLFALVFMWTPPHFWALALVRARDYARAGVPMLPVVRGEKETRTQIFIYTLELVGLTLLMPVFKVAGSVFLISAVILGLWLIYTAWQVVRIPGNKVAWRMYRYSSMYLAFIFLALVVDVLV